MLAITNLPRHTEDEIRRLVESGDFDNGTEVVVQAIHDYVAQRNMNERVRALVREGWEAAERGELIDVTPEFRKELRESARRLAKSGEPLDPDVCG
ncbi:MAG: hypothetical protein H0V37_11945 [Chloroflexia bacterium]|nr:hypothetical protein [Chloroflexia bacterium]